MRQAPVAIVILTYNEEVNIRSCLKSVQGLTDEVFIVDSFSTDNTLAVAKDDTDKIYQNAWVHWAHQRNWALDNLPISYAWVFFLDADERLTEELCAELAETLTNPAAPAVEGYYIKRNFYFMGRWLKHGGYRADYILRLIRKDKARSVGSGAREYVMVQGRLGRLSGQMIHEDHKDLGFWIDKHNKLALLEAEELLRLETQLLTEAQPQIQEGKKIEHGFRKWLREKIWVRMPILIRPFCYFFYRYVVQLAFMDGKEGFIYCFLHGLWYPFLVDSKYLEFKKVK